MDKALKKPKTPMGHLSVEEYKLSLALLKNVARELRFFRMCLISCHIYYSVCGAPVWVIHEIIFFK